MDNTTFSFTYRMGAIMQRDSTSFTSSAHATSELLEELERLRCVEKAARGILPYAEWTIGDESPGHHPTMPSAVASLVSALAAVPGKAGRAAGVQQDQDSPFKGKRETFTVPDGFEAIRDADGRATGEIQPIAGPNKTYDNDLAMAKRHAPEALDQGNVDCLAKRRPGEPMFILLGRDPDAHIIVRLWAERRLAAGGDPEHCEQGLAIASLMEAYGTDPQNAPGSAPSRSAYPRLVPATNFTEEDWQDQAFSQWWNEDGRYLDPDTDDVPWYDKREALAQYAFNAAVDAAKARTAHPCGGAANTDSSELSLEQRVRLLTRFGGISERSNGFNQAIEAVCTLIASLAPAFWVAERNGCVLHPRVFMSEEAARRWAEQITVNPPVKITPVYGHGPIDLEAAAGEHGWVCYNGGPGTMFWMPTEQDCQHELSEDIRPATALEKALFERLGTPGVRGIELDLHAEAAQHSDDLAVDRFAAHMKAKLAKKRAEGRGGWEHAPAEFLSTLLYEHMPKGDPIDVANFCMMLHQTGSGITPVGVTREWAERERDPLSWPPAPTLTATELVMTELASASPERDPMKGEQTILTYCDRTGTWGLDFFEAGWDAPESWIGFTHWLDITESWPGVSAQLLSFAQDNPRRNSH
jgi:hypothetical protein